MRPAPPAVRLPVGSQTAGDQGMSTTLASLSAAISAAAAFRGAASTGEEVSGVEQAASKAVAWRMGAGLSRDWTRRA